MKQFRKARRGAKSFVSAPSATLVLLLCVSLAFGLASMAAAQGTAAERFDRAEAAFAVRQTYDEGLEIVALYEEVLAADPDNVPALLRLAEMHYWLGEVIEDGPALPLLEDGLVFAEQAAELDDTNPDAYYWQGVLTGRIGEERGILQSLFMVSDIMAALERALELDPDYAGAHLLASQVYRKAPGWPLSIGDRKKSVEHALEAVRLEPDKTTNVLNLAEAYLNDRQRDKARETLQQVLDMPLTPGNELLSQKDKDEAAKLLADL